MAALENILYKELSADIDLTMSIAEEGYGRVFIKGGITLTDNVNILFTDIPVSGSKIEIYFEGNVDANGNTLTLLGQNITDLANDSLFIQAFYMIDDWYLNTSFLNNFKLAENIITAVHIDTGTIVEDNIANNTITGSKITFNNISLKTTLALTSDTVSGFISVPNEMRLTTITVFCRETFDASANNVEIDLIKTSDPLVSTFNKVIASGGVPLIKKDRVTITPVPGSDIISADDTIEVILSQTAQQGGEVDVFINGILG